MDAHCAVATAQASLDEPVRTDPQQDLFDYIVGLAQIVTAISVPLLILQIARTRREGQTERTRAFQERFFTPEFQSSASVSLAFFGAESVRDCVQKIRAWVKRAHAGDKCLPRTPRRPPDKAPMASVTELDQVLGFFETFSTAFNHGDLVESVVFDSFATLPVQFFTESWWYICWRREGALLGETETLAQFERMVKELRIRAPWLLDEKPNPELRVLCLPRDAEHASRTTWRQAERLSTALNARADSFDDVVERLRIGGRGFHAKQGPWTITLIPPSIDIAPATWTPRRELGQILAGWLSSLDQGEGLERAIRRLERL